MKGLLTKSIGDQWDKWMAEGEPGKYKLCQLWNEYHVAPWDCYSLGTDTQVQVPAALPANQCQESWHEVLMRRLHGQLRRRLGVVCEVVIPKILRLDGSFPKKLNFTAHYLPTKMLLKAAKMVKKYDDLVFDDGAGFYVLSSDSMFKSIDARAARM